MKHDFNEMRSNKQKMLNAKSFMRSLEGKSKVQILNDFRRKEKEKLCNETFSRIDFFSISGIYFLFRGIDLLYIGESECIITRISQHINDGVKNFDSFKIIVFNGNSKERKKMEKNLIKKHAPPLNVTHNKGINFYGLPQ